MMIEKYEKNYVCDIMMWIQAIMMIINIHLFIKINECLMNDSELMIIDKGVIIYDLPPINSNLLAL